MRHPMRILTVQSAWIVHEIQLFGRAIILSRATNVPNYFSIAKILVHCVENESMTLFEFILDPIRRREEEKKRKNCFYSLVFNL